MITSAPWVTAPNSYDTENQSKIFRMPGRSDGIQVHELISLCPPLDENSAYCNFLQSIHFRETCVLVEENDKVIGFVSAYLKPGDEQTLFIWQVAVHPNARGKGLAYEMMQHLLERESSEDAKAIETTITRDNQGSWSLFKKLDRNNGNQGNVSTFLDEVRHFNGEHDTEYLYRIPLKH